LSLTQRGLILFEFNKHKAKIPLINSYLLVAVFFFIPIKISPAYILSGLILLLWLFEGDLRQKWESLYRHPLTWIFWLYFLLPFISLIWSSDLVWGIKMAKRGIFFLLFPLFVSVTRKEHIKLYMSSFIASVGMTELLSYYNWFQMHYFPGLPEGIRSRNDAWQIAPFVSHIMYNPILAFSAYLLGHAVLFEKLNVYKRYLYWLFLITISINMLISGGRSGQVGFFVMIFLLIFQRFARRPVIATFVAVSVCVVVFTTAYQASDLFRQRTDLAVHQVLNYKQVVNSSVGLRINMYINTYRMFLESPFLGVGVGDFPAEYARINAIHSPRWATVFNPHNQYLFALSTTGAVGGIILLSLLFWPPWLARTVRDEWFRLRIALPLLFVVICLTESYLWRSNTSLMFILFSSILYKNYVRE